MTPVNYHNIQVFHTIASLCRHSWIKVELFVLFETVVKDPFQSGQIQPDILNEISMVLLLFFLK